MPLILTVTLGYTLYSSLVNGTSSRQYFVACKTYLLKVYVRTYTEINTVNKLSYNKQQSF